MCERFCFSPRRSGVYITFCHPIVLCVFYPNSRWVHFLIYIGASTVILWDLILHLAALRAPSMPSLEATRFFNILRWHSVKITLVSLTLKSIYIEVTTDWFLVLNLIQISDTSWHKSDTTWLTWSFSRSLWSLNCCGWQLKHTVSCPMLD